MMLCKVLVIFLMKVSSLGSLFSDEAPELVEVNVSQLYHVDGID
jgi:hypothetical protein